MNLVILTQGYFEKNEEQQQHVVNTIIAEVLIKMLERDLTFKDVINEIKQIIEKAEEQEDYETAKVLLLVNTELMKHVL
jgi:DNA-binding ferritin-like protein